MTGYAGMDLQHQKILQKLTFHFVEAGGSQTVALAHIDTGAFAALPAVRVLDALGKRLALLLGIAFAVPRAWLRVAWLKGQ